jgi:hypothetical protein
MASQSLCVVQTTGGDKMELKAGRTEKNLLTAFAGESQARNRYTLCWEKTGKLPRIWLSSFCLPSLSQL